DRGPGGVARCAPVPTGSDIRDNLDTGISIDVIPLLAELPRSLYGAGPWTLNAATPTRTAPVPSGTRAGAGTSTPSGAATAARPSPAGTTTTTPPATPTSRSAPDRVNRCRRVRQPRPP